MRLIPNVYDVQAVHLVTRGIWTHTSPITSYRGAGRPEATFILERLVSKAAAELGLGAEVVGRDDYARIAEFDALFIRATTSVNHYTFRFSRRAAAEGLVVIDDPQSIARCTNKVFLAEHVGLGLAYWYEKFDVTDFATTNNTDGTVRIDPLGAITTGYGNRPYKGQTGMLRLIVVF